MNWTYRRPFRQQVAHGGYLNKMTMNRSIPYREQIPVEKDYSNEPIDAIRLQLADCHNPYPSIHRHHPYVRTFSDNESSLKRTHSSVRSVSTIETDFVHQRVSTIHTFPSSTSIVERQQMIDDDNANDPILISDKEVTTVDDFKQESTQKCRTCVMLIEIVDQQAQQIRQYTEQISQQTDLLATLARRFAKVEDDKSDETIEQRSTNEN